MKAAVGPHLLLGTGQKISKDSLHVKGSTWEVFGINNLLSMDIFTQTTLRLDPLQIIDKKHSHQNFGAHKSFLARILHE